MNCREFVDFLVDYYENELPEAQHAKFQEHMQLCPPCVAYLESYEQTIRLGRAAFECLDDKLPADVPDGIVKAILEARKAASGKSE
jgi:anti-sigma factor RsiW